MRRALRLVHTIAESLAPDEEMPPLHQEKQSLIDDLQHLAESAKEQARLRNDLHHQLDSAQHALVQFRARQETILRTSGNEMAAQYHAILGFANYLDERIAHHRDTPELREDFDDVCESGFNLKLIAGALDILHQSLPPTIQPLNLAALMQRTMLALAASLDRRAMKLNTAEVDASVMATSDGAVIAHVLWMMMLGLVRHASPESMLIIGCHYNEARTRATVRILVRALEPGKSWANDADTICVTTPEALARTVASHANVRLAELLLQPLDAEITVTPFSHHACSIALTLPA